VRIATRNLRDHVSGPQFQVTATFDDQGGGRTKVTFRMRFNVWEEGGERKSAIM
jgi:hypothetical protein